MNTEYTKSVLPGGIRLITEHMPHVRSVSIGAWIETGSRDESSDLNGISHFLEHMTFKGTTNRTTSEIAESLESVGGSLNAFTGKEVTCYFANVLDEHSELAIDVIADLISNALFHEEDLHKEKKVILEEISSMEDVPDELIHEFFQMNIFNDHPLSNPILGSKKSVTSLGSRDIEHYYRKHYISPNLIISAAGNLDHKTLESYVSKYFQLPSGTKQVRSNGKINSILTEKTYLRNVSQAHICLGNKTFQYNDPQKYSLLLLHALLGGGMSSRLFQNIREKHGVAYSIYTFADFYSDSGLFGVYLGVDKSNISRSLKLVFEEFKKVKQNDISESELKKLKSQVKGNLMLGLESTYSRMNRLAKMEMYLKEYFTLDKVIEGIDEIKVEDIKLVANNILDENLPVSIISPK